MELAIYFAVGLVLVWALYTGYLSLTSQSAKGREIADLDCPAPELTSLPDTALIYCYSVHCGPCKTMTPAVDELLEDGVPIIKLEIPQRLELAQQLGVKATPTLLLIRHGRVEQVNVGLKTHTQILQMLEVRTA
jgi:thiol-disulfide isomerase/thioredoxin